jgi:hypothetical protein
MGVTANNQEVRQGSVGRRRFLQASGLCLLGSFMPGVIGRLASRTDKGYVLVNGWVLPVTHLRGRDDAQEF